MYQTEKDANETDELLKRLTEAEERYQKQLEKAQAGSTLQQEKLEYDLPTDEEIAAVRERLKDKPIGSKDEEKILARMKNRRGKGAGKM